MDLNHLVQEVCSFLEFETAKLGVQIEMDLAPEPITVHVDLVQIEQVLLNLLSNALDALEDTPEAERRLIIRTRGGVDGEARVSVEDSGPGMEPERLAHLFDPFFTTKEGGMGMGLTISQTILENHEGRIWAESEPGRGTVFHVALPGVGEARRDDSGTAGAHGEPEPSTGALRALGASR